ncbi:MAG: hypothetical protein ACR2HD_09355 [Solirubrobacteraceae bacterium]|nr:MAG: hypothetical protein DLM63_01395 [Solirubrobacterales bacterium]
MFLRDLRETLTRFVDVLAEAPGTAEIPAPPSPVERRIDAHRRHRRRLQPRARHRAGAVTPSAQVCLCPIGRPSATLKRVHTPRVVQR